MDTRNGAESTGSGGGLAGRGRRNGQTAGRRSLGRRRREQRTAPGGALRFRRHDGQAAAELVALLPLAALVLAAGWQLVVAGHAVWSAGGAARAAARASALGASAPAAARSVLPRPLERGLEVRERDEGSVRVSVPVPRVLGLPSLGHVSASARFREQR